MVGVWGPTLHFRVADLSALGPGLVALEGRLVHLELVDGALRALLEDRSGAVWLRGGLALLARGDRVSLEGRWTGTSIEVLSIERLARPTRAFPSPGSDHAWLTADDRRRLRFLEQRAVIFEEVREELAELLLLEVETPLAVPSPGLDLHLDAVQLHCDTKGGEDTNGGEDMKGGERFLITSPEYQMKRLLAAGLGDIYQIAKCFRKGELGARHQPEFTMLEWYRSPGELDSVLADTEAIVRAALRAVGRAHIDGERGRIELPDRFDRLSVADAFRDIAGLDVFDVLPDEERFFRIIVEKIEPELGRERPVFLTRWPASMASLARLCPDDPRFAERAELFIDGMELCNAFGELTDPVEQRARLLRDQEARRAAHLPVYPLDERFLAALEDGIPPSGGNALGLDRLVMLACGTRHIDDVVAIPASRL